MSKKTTGTAPNNKKLRTVVATIASGASVSDAIDIGAAELVAISMPAAWTTASITFQNTVDDSTYQAVNDAAGSEVAVLLPVASKNIIFSFAGIKGFGKLKLVSGTAALAVNQGAERLITLVIKEE